MPQLLSLLDRALRGAAVVLLLALLVSVVAGVVFRAIGNPLAWTDEAAQYLLVWTGFVGLMIASRRRSHIRIAVVIDMLPEPLARGLEVLIRLSVIVFAVEMLRHGWPLIGRNWDIDWVSLPLPSGLLYLPVPFVALLLIGQALAEGLVIARHGSKALGQAHEVAL